MNARGLAGVGGLAVFVAALLALLGPGREDDRRPEDLSAAAEVAAGALANYGDQMAAAHERIAAGLESGALGSDHQLLERLKAESGEARSAAFAPVYELTQKTIGRPSTDAPFDTKRAARLMREFARGYAAE